MKWTRLSLTAGALILASAACSSPASAAHPERKDDATRASKNGKLTGTIDGVDVTLTYGRPQVKGRALWGKLVPYGKVWRVGADEATAITFNKPVMIGGEKVDSGSYALFMVPEKDEWTLILNRNAEQWGAYSHDESLDVLRVKVKPKKSKKHTEALEFTQSGDTIMLQWGKLAVPFTVSGA